MLYGNTMVLEMITGSSTVAEALSKTIEVIMEVVFSTKDVFIEKASFADLASYLCKIVPLLKELHNNNINESEGLSSFLNILNREVKAARQLTLECSKRNKVYLLVNCRSYAKRIEDTTREISRALSLIPFGSLEVSSSIVEDINHLRDSMRIKEFKAAMAEEEILEKIESGIQERNVDRSYANNLLVCIADALGIAHERFVWKKEFEEFKSEIENAQLRKDRAEAIQLEQIIALLERADATSSLEEKEIKYLSKRNSLGSQPLEPLLSFYCPITKDVMVDPVETSSGHTFERSAIEKWLADGNYVCPISRIRLDTYALRPNKTLQQSIEEWKDRNTMITIGSIKPKLLLEEEEEVVRFLEQLEYLCEERDLHREWIVLENYIPVLIKLLGQKNRDIRKHALVILCILAKDSDDVKVILS